MSKSVLTLGGKRFIVLPEREYRLLVARADERKGKSSRRSATALDAGDAAEARRRLADPSRVKADVVFRRLGV
jgi:hypothetical protein